LEDLKTKYENLSGDTQESTGFVTPE